MNFHAFWVPIFLWNIFNKNDFITRLATTNTLKNFVLIKSVYDFFTAGRQPKLSGIRPGPTKNDKQHLPPLEIHSGTEKHTIRHRKKTGTQTNTDTAKNKEKQTQTQKESERNTYTNSRIDTDSQTHKNHPLRHRHTPSHTQTHTDTHTQTHTHTKSRLMRPGAKDLSVCQIVSLLSQQSGPKSQHLLGQYLFKQRVL